MSPRARATRTADLGPRLLRFTRDDAIAAATTLVPARVPVAGIELRERGVNLYRCPVCERLFRYDDEYEPMCTGPGATDDHPMTVMVLVGVVAPAPRLRLG